jgi:hypothetical protein
VYDLAAVVSVAQQFFHGVNTPQYSQPALKKLVKNKNLNLYDTGFEVLTAVVRKSSIFWDITPSSPVKVNQRFGGIYCLLLLQSRRIRQQN